TLDQPKAEVLARMAQDINPEIESKVFDQGINPDNLDSFLDGVDLYVDGLDFFAFDIRQRTFAACAAKAIPATTVAPLGMGA
ncbi:ThiF family adenylyltransferase, partial [Acinetobacter baumannii]|nr:ThiF family adenylyltransferase [Acinetobacter baumannii]